MLAISFFIISAKYFFYNLRIFIAAINLYHQSFENNNRESDAKKNISI
jgi:hypothetical protein